MSESPSNILLTTKYTAQAFPSRRLQILFSTLLLSFFSTVPSLRNGLFTSVFHLRRKSILNRVSDQAHRYAHPYVCVHPRGRAYNRVYADWMRESSRSTQYMCVHARGRRVRLRRTDQRLPRYVTCAWLLRSPPRPYETKERVVERDPKVESIEREMTVPRCIPHSK